MPVELISFRSFQLDLSNACLMKDGQILALTPKAFEVLRYLVESAGNLVTKDQLFDKVWPNVIVTDAALKVCVGEIRKLLGDKSGAPEFIQTVHKKGYRFIAEVEQCVPSGNFHRLKLQPVTAAPIGRLTVLDKLNKCLNNAIAGHRRLAFVTGEPGVGKTTVIETFAKSVESAQSTRITFGQCVEQSGPTEVYLPILDALGQLCRSPERSQIIAILTQYAPTWLLQIPAVINDRQRIQLREQLAGASAQRMLREIADALDMIARDRPLIIILEDLHWSDPPTTDLLSYLARRREPAKLMIIGTYRPIDVILSEHPLKSLKHSLLAQGMCTEIALELLDRTDIREYLIQRFPDYDDIDVLTDIVYRQTDGNPLFMVNTVDFLCNSGIVSEINGQWEPREALTEIGVPESLTGMIGQQIDRLDSADQELLKALSVAGLHCSTGEVANALGTDQKAVEEQCELLCQHSRFLAPTGLDDLPDGTVMARYGFKHALYRNVLYESISPIRRVRLHISIGDFLETTYASESSRFAVDLARHFEQGRDYQRAIKYLEMAANAAAERCANREALNYIQRGMEMLDTVSDPTTSAKLELALRTVQGPILISSLGNANPDVEKAYLRARELCVELGDNERLFPVLFGLRSYYLLSGQLENAHKLANELEKLAKQTKNDDFLLEAQVALASSYYFLGRPKQSLAHSEAGIKLYRRAKHQQHTLLYGTDPGIFCQVRRAQNLCILGYPEQALKSMLETLASARTLDPYNLVFTIHNATLMHLYRREGRRALDFVDEGKSLAHKYGFSFLYGWSLYLRSWALAAAGMGQEAKDEIQLARAAHIPESATTRSYLLAFLAEAFWHLGDAQNGLECLTEAAEPGCEFIYAGERARLEGEFLLLAGDSGEAADACFSKAIELNQGLETRLFQLRACVSQVRLRHRLGGCDNGLTELNDVYSRFDEGFDTPDLCDAETLLRDFKAPAPKPTDRKRKNSVMKHSKHA